VNAERAYEGRKEETKVGEHGRKTWSGWGRKKTWGNIRRKDENWKKGKASCCDSGRLTFKKGYCGKKNTGLAVDSMPKEVPASGVGQKIG